MTINYMKPTKLCQIFFGLFSKQVIDQVFTIIRIWTAGDKGHSIWV